MSAMTSFACVVLAYLLGSISFGIVSSRLFGLPDPRSYGSGNPGATNVLRSGKKAAAIVTLVGDAAKGLIAVILVRALGLGEATIAATAVAVFLGHLYPLYFRFKGGKGVATALGVVLGLNSWLAMVGVAVFIVAVTLSRYVSLSSMLAAVVVAALAPVRLDWSWSAAAAIVIAALVVWRHRANIQRLRDKTESKLKFRRSELPPAESVPTSPSTLPSDSGRSVGGP